MKKLIRQEESTAQFYRPEPGNGYDPRDAWDFDSEADYALSRSLHQANYESARESINEYGKDLERVEKLGVMESVPEELWEKYKIYLE